MIVGVPLTMVLAGGTGLVLALLHRDEEFTRHERGPARRRGKALRPVRWDEVVRVGDHRMLAPSRLQRRLGLHIWCLIWTRSGPVLITGHTGDAAEPANRAEAGHRALRPVPPAAPPPRRPVRGTLLAAPGLLLLLAGALVLDDPDTAGVGTVALLSGTWCLCRGLRRLFPWRTPRPGAGEGWTRNARSTALLSVWALVLDALGPGPVWSAALWASAALVLFVLGVHASWRAGHTAYWRSVPTGMRP